MGQGRERGARAETAARSLPVVPAPAAPQPPLKRAAGALVGRGDASAANRSGIGPGVARSNLQLPLGPVDSALQTDRDGRSAGSAPSPIVPTRMWAFDPAQQEACQYADPRHPEVSAGAVDQCAQSSTVLASNLLPLIGRCQKVSHPRKEH